MIKSLLVFKVAADLESSHDPKEVIREAVVLCFTLHINIELTIGRVVLIVRSVQMFHEISIERKRLEDEYAGQMGELFCPTVTEKVGKVQFVVFGKE